MTSPIAYLFPALGSGGRKADELSERTRTFFIPYGEGVTDGRLWDCLHERWSFLFFAGGCGSRRADELSERAGTLFIPCVGLFFLIYNTIGGFV